MRQKVEGSLVRMREHSGNIFWRTMMQAFIVIMLWNKCMDNAFKMKQHPKRIQKITYLLKVEMVKVGCFFRKRKNKNPTSTQVYRKKCLLLCTSSSTHRVSTAITPMGMPPSRALPVTTVRAHCERTSCQDPRSNKPDVHGWSSPSCLPAKERERCYATCYILTFKWLQ